MNEAELLTAKILIVDDIQANVLLFEAMLKSEGYCNVYSTTDSRKAADLYRLYRPDLVLLDLDMPYLNGFDVMDQLKEIESESYLPVLVLTGLSDQSVRIRALEFGARDFLCKPFEHVEALTRIRNLVEVRLLHNAVREQNRILEEKVRERTRKLRETQLDIIRRLGRAAEYRDNETGFHVIRMSHFSACLARTVGFSDTDCEILLYASPMHDVGKIGIPDRILLKNAPLTSEEWTIMKTHTVIGSDLLAGHDSELMQMASELALCHHEKWDGSGYPRGLKGEEIPLIARIVALCDVFDALTSARPYKKAWSIEETMTYIEAERGKHFDPKLVELFQQVLPEILEIKARYADPVVPRPTHHSLSERPVKIE